MRKMTAVLLVAVACLVMGAAPAMAQRDPFDPVIDPNAPTGTTTGTTATTTDGTNGAPAFQPTDGSDALANTGSDMSPWLAIAYGLILLGAGALVIARMQQPVPVRRR